MGRKKIMMDYIKDDRKRMSTFEKRRIGLFKKARELNKLCGVKIEVKIVNRTSLYQFSDSHKEIDSNHDLKVEENFTNESFQDFLSKKLLNHKISSESNFNEYQSSSHGQTNINSDDDEDQNFLTILKKENLLDKYIEINHKNYLKPNPFTNGNNYVPAMTQNSTITTTDDIHPFHFSDSLNSTRNESSDILTNYGNNENNHLYPTTETVSFDNIIKTMQNDPSIFESTLWDSYRLNHSAPTHLDFYSSRPNSLRRDLDTPTLDALMNSQPFSISSDFDLDVGIPRQKGRSL